MAIRTISIVGVGLIGGSFALAMRKVGFEGRILGVSSSKTLDKALQLGVIDEGLPVDEALPQSDLIYLAQPVLRILDQLEEVSKFAPDSALVTDVGSTKGAIVARANELFGEGRAAFLGGHPMAGKEGRGVAIADRDLFKGATYILTPTDESVAEAPIAVELKSWISAIGAQVRIMDAQNHDRVVALTSHLPQLVSTGLAAAVGEQISSEADLATAGSGLRGMTRLAASPFEMWEGILETNLQSIDEALAMYAEYLESLRLAVKNDGARGYFEYAQSLQKKLSPE